MMKLFIACIHTTEWCVDVLNTLKSYKLIITNYDKNSCQPPKVTLSKHCSYHEVTACLSTLFAKFSALKHGMIYQYHLDCQHSVLIINPRRMREGYGT